jgi:hypothetical protein
MLRNIILRNYNKMNCTSVTTDVRFNFRSTGTSVWHNGEEEKIAVSSAS